MDGKKRKKKELDVSRGLRREVAGTMCNVGGRVREGKPPKLWSSFGHGPKTPATGAVDLSAARIPPGLGWKVHYGDRDDDDDN